MITGSAPASIGRTVPTIALASIWRAAHLTVFGAVLVLPPTP